jgi:hypothetical protein
MITFLPPLRLRYGYLARGGFTPSLFMPTQLDLQAGRLEFRRRSFYKESGLLAKYLRPSVKKGTRKPET